VSATDRGGACVSGINSNCVCKLSHISPLYLADQVPDSRGDLGHRVGLGGRTDLVRRAVRFGAVAGGLGAGVPGGVDHRPPGALADQVTSHGRDIIQSVTWAG
jgi:hypothetical protein